MELSIVLIIIGLLIAGVTGGSKLVKSAGLNKLVRDITEINTAYITFFEAYDALPGDFKDAESFWGTTGLKNGDGDGKVEAVLATAATAATGDESSNAFLHLAKAEILSGSYSAQIDAGTYGQKINIGARAVIVNEEDSAGATHGGFATHLSGRNVLLLGSTILKVTRVVLDPGTHSAFLEPRDIYQIDKKIDDGLSAEGIISYRIESAGATTGDVTAAGCASGTGYLLTGTSKACNLVFELENL